MILELFEESRPDTGTMYVVRADGSGLKWFVKKEDAEKFYNEILANPSVLEPTKIILKSDEINVPLIEQNS